MLNIRVPITVVCNWGTAITYASAYKIYTEKSLTTGVSMVLARKGSQAAVQVQDEDVLRWVDSVTERMEALDLKFLQMTQEGTVSGERSEGGSIYESTSLYSDGNCAYSTRIYGTGEEFLDAMKAAAVRMHNFEARLRSDEKALVLLATEISAEVEQYFEKALG